MSDSTQVLISNVLTKRDPSSLFLDPKTQKILKSISQFQTMEIFRKAFDSHKGIAYRLMTNVELEEKLLAYIDSECRKLQMTPVVQVYDGSCMLITSDTALRGFSDANIVVNDLSYDSKTSLKEVFMRKTYGNLKYTSLATSKRISQVYFPYVGRNVRAPNLFKNINLDKCLNEKKYEFILEKLSVQHEPYEKKYHDICSKTYMHINKNGNFEKLRSTRHFGPMAFFLAWHKCIDDLLYDMIKKNFLKNSVEIIALMYKLNYIDENYEDILLKLDVLKHCTNLHIDNIKSHLGTYIHRSEVTLKSNTSFTNDCIKLLRRCELLEPCIKFIHNYIEKHGLKKVQLNIALNTLEEELKKHKKG